MTGDKATRYVILLLALALAAYGQHIIDSREAFGAGWIPISYLHDELVRIFGRPQSVALALPLLFFAVWFFVESVVPLTPPEPDSGITHEGIRDTYLPLRQTRETLLAGALAALALGGWTSLIVLLVLGINHDANWWLFWGSLVCALLATVLLAHQRLRETGALLGWHLLEPIFIAGVLGFFIGLMITDLDAWTYARIGDEGVFWNLATRIATGNHELNYFSFKGANGYHPIFSSVYQANVMRLFGLDMFAWKLSNVLAVAAMLAAFYWLIRTALGLRQAIFATAILACNHILFAYAHSGYDNILALFPTVLALALFIAGLKTRSLPLLFASGIVAGLCFYTFYTARTTIIIMALYLAVDHLPLMWRTRSLRSLLDAPLPIAIGFSLAVLPMFAVDGSDVIGATSERSLYSELGWWDATGAMIDNIPRAFLAFNYYDADHHYVSGTFFDEISAVLMLFGLGYAISNFKEPAYRLLLIWFFVAVFVGGVLHEHAATELPSRLNFALPPAAAFAGIAVHKLVQAFSGLTTREWAPLALSVLAFVVLMPSIFGFNAYRFYEFTPSIHVLTPTAVIYREATRPPCALAGHRSVVVARAGEQGGIEDVFKWYRVQPPIFVAYESYDESVKDHLTSNTFLGGKPVSCLMFTVPDEETDNAIIEAFVDELDGRGGRHITATDGAGGSVVEVLDWRELGEG